MTELDRLEGEVRRLSEALLSLRRENDRLRAAIERHGLDLRRIL